MSLKGNSSWHRVKNFEPKLSCYANIPTCKLVSKGNAVTVNKNVLNIYAKFGGIIYRHYWKSHFRWWGIFSLTLYIQNVLCCVRLVCCVVVLCAVSLSCFTGGWGRVTFVADGRTTFVDGNLTDDLTSVSFWQTTSFSSLSSSHNHNSSTLWWVISLKGTGKS